MEYLFLILICGGVFLLCFLADRGFRRLFRSQKQHNSGTAVRLNKRYGAFGLILIALGTAVCVTGTSGGWFMPVCGVVLMAVGIGLIVYYASFGVFYDAESFVLTTLGKRSTTYTYGDILGQQLYTTAGGVVIELYLRDGRVFQLQSTMTDVYSFMDKAFNGWLKQTGKTIQECDFYDPKNSCWFPSMGE